MPKTKGYYVMDNDETQKLAIIKAKELSHDEFIKFFMPLCSWNGTGISIIYHKLNGTLHTIDYAKAPFGLEI
jgi:hypothetical protein